LCGDERHKLCRQNLLELQSSNASALVMDADQPLETSPFGFANYSVFPRKKSLSF